MSRRRTPLLASAAALLSLAAAAPSASAMCYEVYRGNALVFRSVAPPVDLSKPLHQTVPAAFGRDATLQFFPEQGACPQEDTRRTAPMLANEDVGARFSRSQGPALDLTPYFRER